MVQRVKSIACLCIVLLSLSVTGLLAGCSPSFRSTLAVPRIELAHQPASIQRRTTYGMRIYIDQLVDARAREAIAVFEGREIRPDGNVSKAVITALQAGLTQKGFEFSDTAPVIVSGEIRSWLARIEGGFRGKVSADAGLYFEIIDPANKRIYSGVYNGYSTIEKPGMDEKDVRKALAECMSQAIGQVLQDPQFLRLLSAF